MTPALADRPARLNVRVIANAVVLILALASSIGAAGSNARSPKLKLLTAVTMFNPLGRGQYAPGSSSCAAELTGVSRSASAAAARENENTVLTADRRSRRQAARLSHRHRSP